MPEVRSDKHGTGADDRSAFSALHAADRKRSRPTRNSGKMRNCRNGSARSTDDTRASLLHLDVCADDTAKGIFERSGRNARGHLDADAVRRLQIL